MFKILCGNCGFWGSIPRYADEKYAICSRILDISAGKPCLALYLAVRSWMSSEQKINRFRDDRQYVVIKIQISDLRYLEPLGVIQPPGILKDNRHIGRLSQKIMHLFSDFSELGVRRDVLVLSQIVFNFYVKPDFFLNLSDRTLPNIFACFQFTL